MKWIVSIAIFLLLSGIMLELIAETKYARFAGWVSGVVLLLLFLRPLSERELFSERLRASIQSFYYALGTERIPEELYLTEKNMENRVMVTYKESVSSQIAHLLSQNELVLKNAEMEIQENGEIKWLYVEAEYIDTENRTTEIRIPTVAPIEVGKIVSQNFISPLELYIGELISEFYQMDTNKIEVVIEEAD